VELVVDGQPIALGGAPRVAPFAITGVSRWGLSIVTAHAVDACGNRAVRSQSYLRSPSYFAGTMHPDAAGRVTDGLVVHLTQEAVDDFDRTDVDDVATFGELLLNTLDWEALIPHGALLVDQQLTRDCDGFWGRPEYSFQLVRKPNDTLTVVGPFVDRIVIGEHGLDFTVSIDEIALPLALENLRSHSCEFWIPSSVSLGSHHFWARVTGAQATGRLTVRFDGSEAEVAVDEMTVELGALGLDFVCPDWIDWACDAVGGLVVLFAKGAVTEALQDAIRAGLPPIIGDLINDFNLSAPLDLPPPLSASLQLECGLESITLSGADGGSVDIRLSAQLFPVGRDEPIDAPVGAVRKDGVFPGFGFHDGDYAFGLALKDDLINQLLWAAWYGGGPLEAELDGVQLTVGAGTAPVVMPGRGDYPVDIGLGDLYVHATVDLGTLLDNPALDTEPLHVGFYLSAIVGAAFGIDSGRRVITVEVDPDPALHVDIVQIDDPAYRSVISDLLARLLRLLVPELLDQIVGAIPLADLDLSPLGGTEGGLTLRLASGDIERTVDQDYFTMTGRLLQLD
jgi:hypothetical protein